MKSKFRHLWTIAAMLAAAFAACWRTIDHATTMVTSAYRSVKDVARNAWNGCLRLFKVDAGSRMPSLRLMQAKQSMQRMIRRERLTITGSWRYCPSI